MTKCYKRKQGVIWGLTGYWRSLRLQGVTEGYKGLQGLSRGYKVLPRVTTGYMGLQVVTGV